MRATSKKANVPKIVIRHLISVPIKISKINPTRVLTQLHLIPMVTPFLSFNRRVTLCLKTNHLWVFELCYFVTEMSKAWPPCMRIIVKETNVKNLKSGTLFLVTYDGGTLGREGDHQVLIPDLNISKVFFYSSMFEDLFPYSNTVF